MDDVDVGGGGAAAGSRMDWVTRRAYPGVGAGSCAELGQPCVPESAGNRHRGEGTLEPEGRHDDDRNIPERRSSRVQGVP